MDPVREVWRKDGRYSLEAYQFLFESLEQAVKCTGRDVEKGTGRHVSGQELVEGMRLHALDLFGPLAGQVWRSWRIESTLDWGRIVFLLVEARLLNRQETDSIDDFASCFDFDEAFRDGYRPTLPPEIGARPTSSEE
jgi:uncharacterized repeat protein (TIGR04138 family)